MSQVNSLQGVNNGELLDNDKDRSIVVQISWGYGAHWSWYIIIYQDTHLYGPSQAHCFVFQFFRKSLDDANWCFTSALFVDFIVEEGVSSQWSLPVFLNSSQCCHEEPHLSTSNIVRKLLPKSWEQFFIASTGSDKVWGGHKSSSWEELVKHFSPPSILEELTQLIQTTAAFPRNPIAQRGEIFLQPCYHGWRWPQLKTDCAMLRGSSRGSVSLLKLDVENRRSAQRWVGGCFLLRCRWVFCKHFHLSSRLYMWRIVIACVAALWLQIQLQRLDLYWCWEPFLTNSCFFFPY